MILENTFTSMEKTIHHLIPISKLFTKLILRNKWNSELYIQNLKNPFLFIKCKIFFIFKFDKKSWERRINSLQNDGSIAIKSTQGSFY